MFIDRLIQDTLKHDASAFYKTRILVSIILIYLAIVTLIELWMAFDVDLSGQGRWLGVIICFLIQAGYALSLLVLYRRNWYYTAAHLAIGMTTVGICAGIAVSGGPLEAPSMTMTILPIIMAFVLVGKRGGLLWTQCVLVLHIGFLFALAAGVTFIQVLPPEMMTVQHLAHWLITYSAIIGLMLVVDTLNTRLRVERDNEKRKFEHLATHDPLTDLANRLQFDQSLNKALSRTRRSAMPTGVIVIDLDDFKPINDTLGHDAGDIVLQEISHRLQRSVRATDTVARLGGDEFGIVLEDLPDCHKATAIADKLCKLLAKPIRQLPGRPQVTSSIGIALFPDHAHSKEELLKCADLAMYQAKQHKNEWRLFEADMKEAD